ncbi:MAG: DegV family protein [Oscillospiraceae bacterium]|nr:DegV family protein [Oscillospiraceae bacterium]
MNEFVIYTDSGCDIAPELLAQWDVAWSSLRFSFDGETREYTATDMSVKAFYDRMRDGAGAKTSAINIGQFLDAFEPFLQQGKDILYIGFSSALSTTYHSAVIAAQQLAAQYPERRVIAVDSLSASAGQGMLVCLAAEKRNAGATIEETAAYVEEMKLRICHWVTVDDLEYLKRGGRISPTVAFVGNALGLKPQIHVDNSGSLVNVSKVRGRKKAVAALADKYGELACDPSDGMVYISHSDCGEDARYLADLIHERYGITVQIITDIGTVIGAHTGPGTVALFFVGKER